MNRTYRAVLIGTGSVAESHARAIAETRGRVELLSAVDVDGDRAGVFCRRHGVTIARTDYRQALREEKPDLVLIAAPPSLHTEMSIAAMEAGAWVLCEKPLCASLAEFDRISAAERRTGRYTASVFQQRFGSSTAHLRQLVADGLLGRPLVAVCHTLWYRDAAYYAVPWRGKWATELGGPTMSLGIHTMDHLLYLLGDWAEVRAQAATLDRAIEVEDVSMALIRFAGGALACVVNSALSPRQETFIRIDYQRAAVELSHLYGYTRDNWRLTVAPDAGEDGRVLADAWRNFPPETGPTHASQLADFIGNMDAGTRPLTSGNDARRTLDLLSSLYKSAFTGRPVARGSITPGDPFYTALNGGHGDFHPRDVCHRTRSGSVSFTSDS